MTDGIALVGSVWHMSSYVTIRLALYRGNRPHLWTRLEAMNRGSEASEGLSLESGVKTECTAQLYLRL